MLDPEAQTNPLDGMMDSYIAFVAKAVPADTPEPLAAQLERRARAHEFTTILRKFVDRELLEWIVERQEAEEHEAGPHQGEHLQMERTQRVIELIRVEAITGARKTEGRTSRAVDLSRSGQS